MKALIVTDMQKVITSHKDFSNEIININKIISRFRENDELVIFTKHISENPEDLFYFENEKISIDNELLQDDDIVIEKNSPSIFKGTNLEVVLRDSKVENITIVGFNTEYCCLFSSIAAYDRGFKVTFIEDAIGTCNDENTYEMPGLDINDFVGSFLDWSGVVEVLYTEELLEE